MGKKDPQDVLKDIKGDIEGTSPDKIVFKNLRVREKKDKDDCSGDVDNQEGFSVGGIKTDFCDYSEIGKKKWQLRKKNSLEEWGAFDFFIFAHKLYIGKYGRSWDLNIGGGSLEINRIRDKFYDLFGFCCNLIMRDYIAFFFNNHIDEFIRRNGDFYFSNMSIDWVLISFQEQYNFPARFADYTRQEKKETGKEDITREEVRQAFLVGDTTLVGNYGIVIAMNWLMQIKKISGEKASKLIIDACKNMEKRGMMDVVKNSTECYSPYPTNFIFKSPQLIIMDEVDDNIKLDVEFNDNDRFQFLQFK